MMHRTHTFTFGSYTSTVATTARANLFAGLDNAFFVSDINTSRFVPQGVPFYRLDSGETSKSWEQLEAILSAMLAADLTRESVVVGVGGGVVSDIAAFAASVYMRGCRLVLVPTTLLSMVDAALGGKTAVNFGGYKNMVGTFYPAREVRLCADMLHTLPEREYMSGLAEAVKTAMLGDPDLFRLFEDHIGRVIRRDDALLPDIVWRCVMVKGALVEADLHESGIRTHLNLGHTFAHALESEAGLGSWSHGEAVAWGLARAMEAGVAAGITSLDYAARVRALLSACGYRTEPMPGSCDTMIAAMRKDKKRTSAANRFVLQEDLGKTVVAELDEALIRAVLEGRGVRGRE